MNAEEKAAELERRIEAAVERGEFRFDEGYLSKVQVGYVDTGKCEGCALAAAAFVLSSEREASAARCEELVTHAADLSLTSEDAAQLEMGYEQWDHSSARGTRDQLIYAVPSNSFYKLGKKLRETHAPFCDVDDDEDY